MKPLLIFIGQVLPYIAMAVFVGGLIYRVGGWFKAPVRHKLTMFPAPTDVPNQAIHIATELALFRSLMKGDKKLWAAAWLLHVSLLAVIGGHIVGITFLGKQFTLFGVSEAESVAMSVMLGIVSGIILMAALIYLLFRRFYNADVRRLSDASDFFDLLLILAIVFTGNHMRFVHVDLPAINAYMGNLLHFSPTPLPNNAVFIVHFLLVQILLIYFPFSKLVHLFGSLINRAIISEPVVARSVTTDIVPVINTRTAGGQSL
jgi:nitrate reductase gamma subunit